MEAIKHKLAVRLGVMFDDKNLVFLVRCWTNCELESMFEIVVNIVIMNGITLDVWRLKSIASDSDCGTNIKTGRCISQIRTEEIM